MIATVSSWHESCVLHGNSLLTDCKSLAYIILSKILQQTLKRAIGLYLSGSEGSLPGLQIAMALLCLNSFGNFCVDSIWLKKSRSHFRVFGPFCFMNSGNILSTTADLRHLINPSAFESSSPFICLMIGKLC